MLLMTNATVSTWSGGTPKLTAVAVMVGRPTALDMAQAGGIVRHVVFFEPGTDVAPGDQLAILAWSTNVTDPARRYQVFSADPSGGLGLELVRCVVGERVQR